MFIGLVGNDGSGKTEISNKLKNIYINSIYIKEFDYFFIGKIIKLFFKKRTNTIQKEIKSKKVGITTKILPYIVVIDLILEYFYYKIFYLKQKIIIRDRTAFDFLMSWKELGVSNKVLTSLYKYIGNKYHNFYLDVEPETSYNRRKKQNGKQKEYSFYKEKKELYNNYLNIINFIKVDNNGNIENAVKQVKLDINNILRILKCNTIAISGIDGSGKTTTINNFCKKLDKYNIKYTSIHFYYNYVIIKVIKYIKNSLGLYKKKTVQQSYKDSIKNELTAKKKGKNILWKYFVLCDAFVQYIFMKAFNFNKVIVFDRFFYDYEVSGDFLGIKFNKNRFKKICPKINKGFILTAPVEILYKRKPEHTEDFFYECHNKYKTIQKKYNLVSIDTEKNNEKEVLSLLLSKI